MFVNTLAEVATYVRAYRAIEVSSSTDLGNKIRDAYKALPYIVLIAFVPRVVD